MTVRAPDSADTEWLQQASRYTNKTEEELEALIGRKQRMTNKSVSISQVLSTTSNSLKDEMADVRALMQQGNVDNTNVAKMLFDKLSTTLGKHSKELLKSNLTNNQTNQAYLQEVINSIRALDIPNDPTRAGLPPQLIGDDFKSDPALLTGAISAFVLSRTADPVPIRFKNRVLSIPDAIRELMDDPDLILDLRSLAILPGVPTITIKTSPKSNRRTSRVSRKTSKS